MICPNCFESAYSYIERINMSDLWISKCDSCGWQKGKWQIYYHLMINRDRWNFESYYFRSENISMLESIGQLYELLEGEE